MHRRVFSLLILLMLVDCSAQAGFAQGQDQNKRETQRVVRANEIPPAPAPAPVTEVELKELKASIAVDVLASRSKVFKTKQKINRVAVSDPSVADVVLMTENQFVVIGKNPGAISVTVWCEPNATAK